MSFFYYSQNNSGGIFDEDLGYGVIIEADNAKKANQKAEDIGLYFDGCRDGLDCPCCGDRWYECSEGDETETPEIYGAKHDSEGKINLDWNMPTIIYYKDGTKEPFKVKEK